VSGTLYLISTPIGNEKDITLRAIDILNECDLVICEEWKPARRLFQFHKIDKPLVRLNEHSTAEDEKEIVDLLLLENKTIALISDCGTPLIADPGSSLVKTCIAFGITVIPVPGASSILAAVVVSGFSLEQFSFIGFLPREKDERKHAASALRNRTETLVLLEAPYRLQQVIADLTDGIGTERQACVCLDLTLANEKIIRGSLAEIREYFQQRPFKGEFVIVIKGAGRSVQRNLPRQKRNRH
jgi:16S rRNA (cytidine1402-2'-O)-methyltransferase